MSEIWQVVLDQAVTLSEMKNVLYYQAPDEAIGEGTFQEYADAFGAVWDTEIKSSLAVVHYLNSVTLRRVDQADWPSKLVTFTGGSIQGTADFDILAHQVAMLVTHRGYSLPPNKTRMYLGGWTEASMTAGVFIGAAAAAAIDLGNALTTITPASGPAIQKVSVRWDHVLGYVTDWNPVSVVTVQGVPVIQRRRRLGQGI